MSIRVASLLPAVLRAKLFPSGKYRVWINYGLVCCLSSTSFLSEDDEVQGVMGYL